MEIKQSSLDGEYVKIGVEIGEHELDYENIIEYIKSNFDIKKIDFVLIFMKPIDIREGLWYEWAEFFKNTKSWFAFLYTQQRGAPKGRVSHLTKEIVSGIKEIAGSYFIGDMIGETGGLCSWPEGHYEDIGMEKPDFTTMSEAKKHYVNHVTERVNIDREFDVPAILAVEATTIHRYNFEAGVDYTFVEVMCGNPEVMFASARGANKAYHRKWWASHIANEWYGGYRNEDPMKYKRLKLAYFSSYLAGASCIYPESGDLSIASYGDDYSADSKFCRMYRSTWNEFEEFVHKHPRPRSGPKVKIGFVQGNLDAWTGWGGSTVWNRFNKDEWVYGDAEYSWNILDGMYKGERWHVSTMYGQDDMSFSVPFGQYDIVPVEAALDVLKEYSCLVFAGWNTMTDDIYQKLKEYVYSGGKLFMTAAHLNTSDKRDGEWSPVNNGDYSDLFGCRINGKGRKLNWGVKFLGESIIPGYKYPSTKTGICDPILSAGNIHCADVEVTDGRISAILADKFSGWRENSPVIMVEKAYGEGYASLFTTLDYPGSRGMERLYKTILKAAFSAEQESEELRVFGSDKLYYSVYEGGGKQFIIYALNTDFNVPVNVQISFKGMTADITIASCEMAVVYIQGDFICKD
jgi:hypothetical protein